MINDRKRVTVDAHRRATTQMLRRRPHRSGRHALWNRIIRAPIRCLDAGPRHRRAHCRSGARCGSAPAGSGETNVMRPRARGCMSATPICGQSGCPGVPSPVIATKPPVYGRISMPSAVLSTTSNTGRSTATAQLVGNTHSGWSLHPMPNRQWRHYQFNASGPQHGLRHRHPRASADAPTESPRRTAQFDQRSGLADLPGRSRRHPPRLRAGETQSQRPRLRQQCQVGSRQRGYQIAGARCRCVRRRRC